MAKYYTLFIFDKETKTWHDEFGADNRADVQIEYDETYWDLQKAFKKIIAWDDEKNDPQEFIANKNRELNGETIEPAAEYYVLRGRNASGSNQFITAPPRWKRPNFEGCTYGDLFDAIEFTSAEKAQFWIENVRSKQRSIWGVRSFQLASAYPVKCKREIVKTMSFDEFKAGV